MKKLLLDSHIAEVIGLLLLSLLLVTIAIGANGLSGREAAEQERVLSIHVPDGVLVYGADDSAPPLRFVDEDGIYKGVVVDYMNQLSLELGIEISTVPYKWEHALEALKNGETDLCDMFSNPEREQHFVFTDPIYILRTVMVVEADRDCSLDDIHTMSVATQEGDYANWYMKEYYPTAKLKYVHDVGEGLKLLIQGEVDAVIGDEPVMLYYADQLDVEEQIATIETALYEEPVGLALPRSKAELVPVLNRAIKNINEKGQLEKIQQKWFGISTPLIAAEPNADLVKALVVAAIGLLFIILLAQVNNRSLKKQVNKRTEELEARKNELQLIFDQMPEGIVLVDEEGIIRNGSSHFFRQKIPAEQLYEGIPCRDVMRGFCGNPSCQRFCGETEGTCIALETLRRNDTIIRKVQMENDIYEVRSVPTSFYEGDTPRQAILMIVRDITLDEANSQQLLQTSKMVAIGQLAAGMAHQIRNPLGIIRTQSFIIRNGRREDEKLQKSLNYIDDSVKRASEIIDNVMNFWRVSDDTQTEFSVRAQLESVVLLQEKEFSNAGITVDICCDPALRLCSSADALKHILHNLVSNAVDAMEGGGRLTLSAVRDGSRVELHCEDTGCGISEKNLQNLFNPFFTTKEPGKGTGLGLFIVYSEVEKVGGTIDVHSKEGEGTRFVIRIPDGQVKHE